MSLFIILTCASHLEKYLIYSTVELDAIRGTGLGVRRPGVKSVSIEVSEAKISPIVSASGFPFSVV